VCLISRAPIKIKKKEIKMRKNKKQIAGFLIFFISLLFVVPTVLAEVDEDKFGYATFIFTYDNPAYPHPYIQAFIYNVEYIFDGIPGTTDRYLVSFPMKDMRNHTFQVFFGGEVFEYKWKGDITETIVLPTKSIQSQVYWKDDMTLANNTAIYLWLFNGKTMWMKMTSILYTDDNGTISIDGWIMGKYLFYEAGKIPQGGVSFFIGPEVMIYQDIILI